ncbi:MAG: 2Fe-2S iron-sulfur cluster-binding protein [Pseudobdellovibrionaceae bacterium]
MKIKFVPTGREIEADPNKTLLQLCVENNIEIKSICKGVPSCAECRVRIVEGEHNIVPPSKAEMSLIGTNYFIDQRRLSCQVHCYGDITVDLTEQIERSEIQSKKVRGFRAPGQKGSHVETQAKQGTLVLEESAVKEPHHHPHGHHPGTNVQQGHPEEGAPHLQQTEGRDPRQSNNRNRRGNRGRDRNRDRNQGQNQNRNNQRPDRSSKDPQKN